MKLKTLWFLAALPFVLRAGEGRACAQSAENLLPDPSIEAIQSPNQFGIPYAKWSGWLYEGSGVFRNGKVAHSGRTSAEMRGTSGVKMRLYSPTVSAAVITNPA